MSQEAIFAVAVGLAAFLYSMVGHGGASGYLAAGALLGLSPSDLRVSVLALNLLVSSLSAWAFWRAGHLKAGLLVPLAMGSMPAAFYSARLPMDPGLVRQLVGVVLALSALRLMWPQPEARPESLQPSSSVLFGVGLGLGFLAGLTGVGGGIFLSPLLVLTGWCNLLQAAAVSALFIWLNSASALGSLLLKGGSLTLSPSWLLAGLLGGLLGSRLGSRGMSNQGLRWVLAVVLAVASAKLLLT